MWDYLKNLNMRIIKIENMVTKKISYQIQKKHFLFGWIGIGNRRNGTVGDFSTLEEAKLNYQCLIKNEYYKITIIQEN